MPLHTNQSVVPLLTIMGRIYAKGSSVHLQSEFEVTLVTTTFFISSMDKKLGVGNGSDYSCTRSSQNPEPSLENLTY